MKLQVNFDTFRQHLSIFNNAIRSSWYAHFTKLVSENQNTPRVLFWTTDRLLNASHRSHPDIIPGFKCDKLAVFPRKVSTVRLDINRTFENSAFETVIVSFTNARS